MKNADSEYYDDEQDDEPVDDGRWGDYSKKSYNCPSCGKSYADCSCSLPYDELFPSEEDFI